MTEQYTIKFDEGITKIKLLVTPSVEMIKSIINELDDNYPCQKRLWDLSEIKFNFNTSDIQIISNYGKRKLNKTTRLALYAIDDLEFGELRQFEAYREEDSMHARVFRNEQDAIKWLNS